MKSCVFYFVYYCSKYCTCKKLTIFCFFKVIKDVLVALANQDAYYRVFNDFIRLNPDILEEYDKGLLHQTWIAILDFSNKQMWFRRKLAVTRYSNLLSSLNACQVYRNYSTSPLQQSCLQTNLAHYLCIKTCIHVLALFNMCSCILHTVYSIMLHL